ncbi:MAG TPA: site-2 protease family protein [Candidatus Eremiobacteraceae bacterium]|nr:site-2 protease family protein [Candidatus Eremiobacteraceae bacterium]
MSTITPDLIRNCKRCSHELPPGALVCDQCHALVHSEKLDQLASEAKALEAKGDFWQAREVWMMGLPLLPPNSRQAIWIQQHARSLDSASQAESAPPSDNKWARKLGPVGPIAVLLAKSKMLLTAIFKLKFLLSFVAFVGIYWAAFGMKFGIGFAVLIFLHEMGHFIDIKRRGLPAEMPVFLPGLGAYVRWQALGVPLETRAAISLAGPLAGFLTALACTALWWQTGSPLWAALARAGAVLNLLNLIPVWVLDGGQAVLALSKTERIVLLTACLALWLVLGENMFFLVALGAGYQVFFPSGLPARPSRATTIYYVTVLTALGVIIRVLPGAGLGVR